MIDLGDRAKSQHAPVGGGLRLLWLCLSGIPLCFFGMFLALTLRSIPETDDFCFSDRAGFIETVLQWYRNVGGRVVPLSAMQIPAKLGRMIGVDYFSLYGLFLLLLAVCFLSAMLLAARRILPQKSCPQHLFFGASLTAVIVSTAPSLREMLYWLPGVTCYTLPEALIILIVAELSSGLIFERQISPTATGWLALACITASLCNEFTSVWILVWVLGSLIARSIMRTSNIQLREHVILAGCTVTAACIVLFAPGNAIRRTLYPAGGALKKSIELAFSDFGHSTVQIFSGLAVSAWFLSVVVFVLARPEPQSIPLRRVVFTCAYLISGAIFCIYFAQFAGRYATGENLASRARNEVFALSIASGTFALLFICSCVGGRIANLRPGRQVFGPAQLGLALLFLLGGASYWALWTGPAKQGLDRERPLVETFWLESMLRHVRLSSPGESDVVVPPHRAFPSLLAEQDIHDEPGKLPNDCVARFYGKNTVRLQTEPPEDFIAALSDYLPSFKAEIGRLPAGEIELSDLVKRSIEVPTKLNRGVGLSTPWGGIRLRKDGQFVQFDLVHFPASICVPLYFGLGNIRSIDKIEPTGLATGFESTPVSEESAIKACNLRTQFIRFLVSEAAMTR